MILNTRMEDTAVSDTDGACLVTNANEKYIHALAQGVTQSTLKSSYVLLRLDGQYSQRD